MSTGPEISDLDEWISQLKQCHPLKESQVKSLCAKVFTIHNSLTHIYRQKKYLNKNQTFNQ